MDAIRRRKHLIAQLIRAARGQRSPSAGSGSRASTSPPSKLLPCFPLQRHHIGQLGAARVGNNSGVATPSDFHSYLCDKILRAQDRVVLASLYIGVGSNVEASKEPVHSTAEDELLQSLHTVASGGKVKKIQVLLDSNRALRNVTITSKAKQSHATNNDVTTAQTNSAEAVFSRLKLYRGSNDNLNSGLFLFPVNDKRLCAILPSPLDEVAGVFHIKAYIVDDELILSGANLSEEYFTNRLDRYMLIQHGGGGLVDFYANLCNILCQYATRYEGAPTLSSLLRQRDEEARKVRLEQSLMDLFNRENESFAWADMEESTEPIVAYAIPTFQMPTSFLGRPLRLPSDTDTTRNVLISALDSKQPMVVRLSSAYLNLTPKLMSVLTAYRKNSESAPYILTAGEISHGFSPKSGSQTGKGFIDKIKSTIPKAFMALLKETSQSIIACGGKVLLYERSGWTFHAKGLWVTATDGEDHKRPEIINSPSSLILSVIGSGNYGARSEDLDVESNCILVFGDSDDNSGEVCSLKKGVAAEWNSMCESSHEFTNAHVASHSNRLLQAVLEMMKKYL
ncbi:hypothetical protein ACHAWF_002292 [Thalassiosira exigua]